MPVPLNKPLLRAIERADFPAIVSLLNKYYANASQAELSAILPRLEAFLGVRIQFDWNPILYWSFSELPRVQFLVSDMLLKAIELRYVPAIKHRLTEMLPAGPSIEQMKVIQQWLKPLDSVVFGYDDALGWTCTKGGRITSSI